MWYSSILEHKKKFSKSDFGWKNDFDAMARKTVLRNLLNHWGILSIQMQNGMSADIAATEEDAAEAPVLVNEDGEIIDIDDMLAEANGFIESNEQAEANG